jgi:hypothetical protein
MDPTNDFDKACRGLAQPQPGGLFAWLLPGHELIVSRRGAR